MYNKLKHLISNHVKAIECICIEARLYDGLKALNKKNSDQRHYILFF